MRDHGSFDGSEVVVDYIGDESTARFSDLDLVEFQDALLDVRLRYAGKKTKSLGGYIDSDVVEPIHRMLTASGATPFQLSQLGFWRWLSNLALNGTFWNFINWRLGGDAQVNWGITAQGSIIEVYFYRAWLRGQKMHDVGLAEPYRYAKLGSSDVWRSHILRQEFGRDREFVKAFLDTVYDADGATLVGTAELRTKLIPSLRAWTSNSTYSHLTYAENKELIERLRAEIA